MNTTDKYKKQVNFIIHNMTNSSDIFPVYNSIFLENKYIDNIKNYPYNLIIKNVETMKRAILLLYIDDSLNKKAVLVLKDGTLNDVIINCKEEYYRGSLFDVSFDSEKIIICDTYVICDYRVNNDYYSERLNRCKLFINEIMFSDIKIESVIIKESIESVVLKENEELFFIPETIPYISGINKASFKWRPTNLINISLKVEEIEDGLNFYTTNFRNDKLFAQLCNTTGTQIIKDIKSLKDYSNNCIIDFNIEEGKFLYKKVNLDKIYPNNIRYIEKVLFIKNEALNLFDLNI